MLHGVRLVNGGAEWYRNRWVRTAEFRGDPRHRSDGSTDLSVTPANTHIIEHGGMLLALAENGLPYQVDRELETVGPVDFDGRLHTAMTAHPKEDPVTGELHFFGYGMTPPFVTYHCLSPAGELEYSRVIDVPAPTMMHDFAITEHYVLWLDLPMRLDAELLAHGGIPVRWDESYGARLGVMSRRDGSPVRWFDIDPCYIFHVGNAREDDAGRIVLDAVRHVGAVINAAFTMVHGRTTAGATGSSTLHRWILDPATGRVSLDQLDDLPVEFPTLNEQRVGHTNRYLYAKADRPNAAVVRYDVETGQRTTHDLGPDRQVGEAVFVPAVNARNEDEGWLLSVVTDRSHTASELLVLDATDLPGSPVAAVQLPRAVPAGFHGSWIPDSTAATGGR
jgi:carotenoid cleavage dioxygenase